MYVNMDVFDCCARVSCSVPCMKRHSKNAALQLKELRSHLAFFPIPLPRRILVNTKAHSLSRELRTASSRGRYGEHRQRDPCLKHTYKNTTCWPATAYDVTTGANHSIKGCRENTSFSSSSSMTVLFEACILLVRTIFYCYYGEH